MRSSTVWDAVVSHGYWCEDRSEKIDSMLQNMLMFCNFLARKQEQFINKNAEILKDMHLGKRKQSNVMENVDRLGVVIDCFFL